jgi:hypothetical protein
VHDCLGHDGDDWVSHAGVPELLSEPVTDHPLSLGAERVERIWLTEGRVSFTLQGKQADLRAVAVTNDQFVLGGKGREGVRCAPHMPLLDHGIGLFAAFQERIATQGNHDSHISLQTH